MSIWKRSSSCLQARAMSAAFSDAEITADTNERMLQNGAMVDVLVEGGDTE